MLAVLLCIDDTIYMYAEICSLYHSNYMSLFLSTAKLEKEFLSAEAAEASIATCVLVHLNEISTSKLEEYR